MNAPIKSTLTLETVGEHFARWRSSKKKGEPIPEQLWREAIDLVDGCGLGISQVTRTLRLSGSDLNKRRGIIGGTRCRKGTDVNDTHAGATFMEIDGKDVVQVSGLKETAAWLELQRPDGLRLRIHPGEGSELLALVDRFMGA